MNTRPVARRVYTANQDNTTTAHIEEFRTTAGSEVRFSRVRLGKGSGDSNTVTRLTCCRVNDDGVGPTSSTAFPFNTRSPAAVGEERDGYTTPPTILGRSLLVVAASQNGGIWGEWSAPRPWAYIYALNGELTDTKQTGTVGIRGTMFLSEDTWMPIVRPARRTRTGLYFFKRHWINHPVKTGGGAYDIRAPRSSYFCAFVVPRPQPRGRQSFVVLQAAGLSAALGTASEADTTPALGRSKTKAIALASENDTAQGIARTKARALGTATETDTAPALGRSKTKLLGTAIDTSSAPALGKAKTRPIATASETDTAQGIARAKARALASAAETDTAQGITKTKARAAAAAAETDTAPAMGRLKSGLVGVVVEADSALALTRAKSRAILSALEADTAGAVSFGATGEPVAGPTGAAVVDARNAPAVGPSIRRGDVPGPNRWEVT